MWQEYMKITHGHAKDVSKTLFKTATLVANIFDKGKHIFQLVQCLDLPTIHKQAATASLPISLYGPPALAFF